VKWLLLFIFGVIPLVRVGWWWDQYELPKIILLFLIVNCGFIFNGLFSFKKLVGLLKNWLVRWQIIFLGWWLISAMFNGSTKTILWGAEFRNQGWLLYLTLIEFSWLVGIYYRKSWEKYISYGGLMVAVASVANWAWIISHQLYQPLNRLVGPLGNSNFTGGFLALISAFSLGWWDRLIYGALIALTGSRSAILAWLVIFIFYYKNIIFRSKYRLLICGLVMAGGVLAIWPTDRLPSDQGRIMLWQKAYEGIAQKPWWGWGMDNFARVTDGMSNLITYDKAHNDTLEMMVGGGIVAGAIYWLIMGMTILRLVKYPKYLSVLMGYVIISGVNTVGVSEIIFAYLAMGVALAAKQKYVDKSGNIARLE